MLYANSGTSPRETLQDSPHVASDAVWLDLVSPTESERGVAERITGLRIPSREDLTEIESSSRIYTEEGVIYLSMPYSYWGADERSHITPVGFVLAEKHLLTVRYEELPAFDTFTEKFSHSGLHGSAEIFVGLLEGIVDRVADVLERVAAELDTLSKSTFKSEDLTTKRSLRRADRELRNTLTQVGKCGDTLGNLRDTVLAIGRIATFAQQACAEWAKPNLRDRLTTLRQDVASLNDYDQQLNGKVSFLLDAVLGFINIEQNNGVKVLTVVSVVGIPPTFVVGLYGMNFKDMPELGWEHGYMFGWAMILVSVVIPLVWFRVKGWI